MQILIVDFFRPHTQFPANSTTKWQHFTGLLYSKRSKGNVEADSKVFLCPISYAVCAEAVEENVIQTKEKRKKERKRGRRRKKETNLLPQNKLLFVNSKPILRERERVGGRTGALFTNFDAALCPRHFKKKNLKERHIRNLFH